MRSFPLMLPPRCLQRSPRCTLRSQRQPCQLSAPSPWLLISSSHIWPQICQATHTGRLSLSSPHCPPSFPLTHTRLHHRVSLMPAYIIASSLSVASPLLAPSTYAPSHMCGSVWLTLSHLLRITGIPTVQFSVGIVYLLLLYCVQIL
jgi:hypothetical protein